MAKASKQSGMYESCRWLLTNANRIESGRERPESVADSLSFVPAETHHITFYVTLTSKNDRDQFLEWFLVACVRHDVKKGKVDLPTFSKCCLGILFPRFYGGEGKRNRQFVSISYRGDSSQRACISSFSRSIIWGSNLLELFRRRTRRPLSQNLPFFFKENDLLPLIRPHVPAQELGWFTYSQKKRLKSPLSPSLKDSGPCQYVVKRKTDFELARESDTPLVRKTAKGDLPVRAKKKKKKTAGKKYLVWNSGALDVLLCRLD